MSHVYFVANNHGAVKIGVSRRVHVRVNSLRTSHADDLRVLGVMEGDRNTEQDLHMKWAAHRLNGEWFSLTEEIREFIRLHTSAMPEKLKKTRKAQRSEDDRARQTRAMEVFFKICAERYGPASRSELNAKISQDTGIASTTIGKWQKSASMPSGDHFLVLVLTYGPSVLAGMSEQFGHVPQWMVDGVDYERDPEEFRRRKMSELAKTVSSALEMLREMTSEYA
jgi:hypothetical protein